MLGDARLALEREPAQQFDVLAIDAFSSDAIPVHLITAEALAVYRRHMKPGGIIAFHVTNRFLNLVPVVEGLSRVHGLFIIHIADDGDDSLASRSDWLLLSDRRESLDRPTLTEAATEVEERKDWRIVDRRFQQPGPGAEVAAGAAGPRRYNGAVPAPAPPPASSPLSRIDPARYRALVRPVGARFIETIDQRALPHCLVTTRIEDAEAAAVAIRDMWVRGAPLIGAVGAYGLALALDRDASDAALASAHAELDATRPTAVNLRWALDRVRAAVATLPSRQRADAAWREADAIAAEDVAINHAIGINGLALLRQIEARKGAPVQVMTHCNAGALATCGWGTATAPVFLAHAAGIPVHVWVSETRPRLQGAQLTAWELAARGVPHTIFVDGASGLLMRRGDVDIVIVGADRVAANGDVCNKIGTYDKALAAVDNGIPFYAAVPSPTFDFALPSGDAIPIEARDADEVLCVAGRDGEARSASVRVAPAGTRAVNYAFDVTPARLVTGLVTERGIAAATPQGIAAMFADCTNEPQGIGRTNAAHGRRRDSARDECARHQPGQVGQRQRALAYRRLRRLRRDADGPAVRRDRS